MAETLKQSKESIIQARIMVTSGKGGHRSGCNSKGAQRGLPNVGNTVVYFLT